jgi:hypothetical protein
MLARIIDLIAGAFRSQLRARLAEETAGALADFAADVERALGAGDLTADGLAGRPAVGDKPKRKVAA